MYLFGTLIVTGALAYAAIVLLGLPTLWVGIACLVVLGLGIMGAAGTGPSRLVHRTSRTSTKRVCGALVTALIAIFYVGVEAEEPKKIPVAEPVPTAKPISPSEEESGAKMVLPAQGVPAEGEVSAAVDPADADRNKDGDLSERELALQDHRKQLEIYDLNDDKKISKDEWKAANLKDQKRAEKFFMIDKDEDGEIDENEALQFLKERISVDSTYVDAKSEDSVNPIKDKNADAAPSEVRVTLFSIPIGD